MNPVDVLRRTTKPATLSPCSGRPCDEINAPRRYRSIASRERWKNVRDAIDIVFFSGPDIANTDPIKVQMVCMQSSSPVLNKSKLVAGDIVVLADYGARTTWPANFQIYQRGAPADGLSLVLRGHVVLRNRMRTGRCFVPAIVTPGEMFGIEGLVREGNYVTDAYAAAETETLFVSGIRFRSFVRERPGEALHLVGQLMSERSHLLEKLHELASQSVEARLVASLQRLSCDRSFLAEDGTIRIELRHHRLLCEMVGATRESIALALGRLAASDMAEQKGTAFWIAPVALASHINEEYGRLDGALPVTRQPMRMSP